MTPIHEPHEERHLDGALRHWKVNAALPPRFQEQVWQRIARAEAKVSAPAGVWTWLRRMLETTLPRPKVAAAFITALLVLGVAAGSLTAQVKSSELSANLGKRYVQSIDPYLSETSRP